MYLDFSFKCYKITFFLTVLYILACCCWLITCFLNPCRTWSAPFLLLGSVFPPERCGQVRTGFGSGPDQCPVGGALGGGRRALEARSAGSGRLCSSPALDNRPDPGGRMAAEHLRSAGIQRTSAGPTLTGGSRGGPVRRHQTVSGVSRGH